MPMTSACTVCWSVYWTVRGCSNGCSERPRALVTHGAAPAVTAKGKEISVDNLADPAPVIPFRRPRAARGHEACARWWPPSCSRPGSPPAT